MQVTDEMIERAARIIADDLKEIGLTSESLVANADGTVGPLWTTYISLARHALTAALSDQERAVEVKIKPLEFNDEPCPAAACAFGHYVINPIYSHVELLIGYGRMSMTGLGRVQLNNGASIDDLRSAAQADYEQRIRSALADAPVEPVKKSSDEMLRLAVAAVLEADTEFRAHMPKGWEGDPLSDEIDGLRRCFEASPPLSRQGEDRAEVDWLTRPVVGIENRTAQEVFDIMADRIRLAAARSGSATTTSGTGEA